MRSSDLRSEKIFPEYHGQGCGCTSLTTEYHFYHLSNSNDAEKALNKFYTSLNGKMIRITYSSRDSSARRSGIGNLFIKNLDKSVDNKTLHETFSGCGSIVSCKVATDHMGQSKGYGFVQFESEDSAKNAIEKLNGKMLNDKQIFVGHFIRKVIGPSSKLREFAL